MKCPLLNQICLWTDRRHQVSNRMGHPPLTCPWKAALLRACRWTGHLLRACLQRDYPLQVYNNSPEDGIFYNQDSHTGQGKLKSPN